MGYLDNLCIYVTKTGDPRFELIKAMIEKMGLEKFEFVTEKSEFVDYVRERDNATMIVLDPEVKDFSLPELKSVVIFLDDAPVFRLAIATKLPRVIVVESRFFLTLDGFRAIVGFIADYKQ